MPRPNGLLEADDIVAKLAVAPGQAALRIGEVAAYDRSIEHTAGQLERAELDLPLRFFAARFGTVLCFALEEVDAAALAAELVRVVNPAGAIWVVVWKKPHLRPGWPSWDAVQEAMLSTGWVDHKILSFGDEAYGTRYAQRKALRPA